MVSQKKEKIFYRALEEAEKSNMLFQHGCVATYGGKIIASGFNYHIDVNQCDLFLNDQCSCHAEMSVLKKIYLKNFMKKRKLHKIMKKTTLFVSRKSKTHKSVNSAPCEKCMNMINKFKIKKIVFSENSQLYEYNSKDFVTTHKTFGDLHLIEQRR
jgi:deoxycytidylate deaminase